MAERIPQSIAKRVTFRAYLSSDGKTLATGKTIVITISKNGGAFGNPAAGATNATEISSGFYYFDLGTGDGGTLGPLAWKGVEATINDAGDVYEVANPHNGGFDGVPNAVANASNGLMTNGTGAGQFSVDGSGNADVNVVNWKGATAPAMTGDPYAAANSADNKATTILNRIGAFAGSGLNTILGFLRAMAAKAAALTPSDLSSGNTFDNTADSLQKIAEAAGHGPVLVDHNYGGTDNLTYEDPNFSGIDGATVQAFKASDFSAGRRSLTYVVATTKTDINGRWTVPMMLDPGAYVLVASKPGTVGGSGGFGPNFVPLTIA